MFRFLFSLYESRKLDADVEFPSEFPEVRGRPWPLNDWVQTNGLTRKIGGGTYLKK